MSHTHADTLKLTSPEQKAEAKSALQSEQRWPKEPRRAFVCIVSGMTEATGGELLESLLPGLATLQAQILILGKGSEHFGKLCTTLAKERAHQVAIIPNSDAAVEEMLKASDIALFCGEPTKAMAESCLKHGIVPVCMQAAGLTNYNPNQESGNAFLYEGETPWHCFAALVRAIETYRFPFDWKTIQRNGMEMLGE